MPYARIWIHLVWATKVHHPFLDKNVRGVFFRHIWENCRKKGIYLDCIGGYENHIHCLVSLGVNQTISNLVNLLKGESSYWMNKQQLLPDKFEWQDDYIAVSVSESAVHRVREYILNQEQHHRKKPFEKEVQEFLEKYHFQKKR